MTSPITVRVACELRVFLTNRIRRTARSGATIAHALSWSFVPPVVTDGHHVGHGPFSFLSRAVLSNSRARLTFDASDRERLRLSHDIHDGPIQTLASVLHELDGIPHTNHASERLRGVADELRAITTGLHPSGLEDLGVASAIEALRFDGRSMDVAVSLAQEGHERAHRPPPDVEIAVFRILQEAITNAVVHSGGRAVHVQGHVLANNVAVDVVDDGRGLATSDLDRARRSGHIGLASMRRRAEGIDARLSVEPSREGGTVVRLRWRP